MLTSRSEGHQVINSAVISCKPHTGSPQLITVIEPPILDISHDGRKAGEHDDLFSSLKMLPFRISSDHSAESIITL